MKPIGNTSFAACKLKQYVEHRFSDEGTFPTSRVELFIFQIIEDLSVTNISNTGQFRYQHGSLEEPRITFETYH